MLSKIFVFFWQFRVALRIILKLNNSGLKKFRFFLWKSESSQNRFFFFIVSNLARLYVMSRLHYVLIPGRDEREMNGVM